MNGRTLSRPTVILGYWASRKTVGEFNRSTHHGPPVSFGQY